MKKTILFGIIALIAIVAFSGLMGSLTPPASQAAPMNHENLIFTFAEDVDTGAGAGPIIYPGGDSVVAVSGITTRDEVRCALKIYDMAVVGGDSITVMHNYVDSITIYNGYIKPSVWTTGADYLIIWRDKIY